MAPCSFASRRYGRQVSSCRLNRRTLLTGATAGVASIGLGSTAQAHRLQPRRHPRVLVATNEPWGTYHVDDLLSEVRRRGANLTQLVPDLSQIDPTDPVPVATLEEAPDADLLVLAGADEWPATCAGRFRTMPRALSAFAYLGPEQGEYAHVVRRGARLVTAVSPAAARSFGSYLGIGRPPRVLGDPQTDALPEHSPEADTVLVLTSVTYPDDTGDAAPGTQLLLDSAARLADVGKHIVVGLHPREDPRLWNEYEISDVDSVDASARAEVAIGIPGTVFPLVAAVGTPVVGCVDAGLDVPDYILGVCSSTIDTAGDAVGAVGGAELPDEATLADAVGPVGGSSARVLDAWTRAARR